MDFGKFTIAITAVSLGKLAISVAFSIVAFDSGLFSVITISVATRLQRSPDWARYAKITSLYICDSQAFEQYIQVGSGLHIGSQLASGYDSGPFG